MEDRSINQYNTPVKNKKLMVFDEEARQKLAYGVELIYKAVCSTLSPKGRNVAINRNWGSPIVVHDGVTVAKEVKDKNKFVQMGINLTKEAAQKTNDEAGDGTTSSILIAYEIVKQGMKSIDKGSNPMVLKDQIMIAKNDAIEGLKSLARNVKTKKDLIKVATISSASDEIGKLVGQVVYEAGETGLVTVEEARGYDTYIEYTEGMSLDKGYISPYFVTNPRHMEALIDMPYIIITDRAISTNAEIIPLIEEMVKRGIKDIVLIATVTGQALKTLVTNKLEGTINCLVIKPPSYGENVRNFLEDIAIATGGRVLSEKMGYTPKQLAELEDKEFESWFGRADTVASTAKATTIINGRGDKKAIQEQVTALKERVSDAANQPEKERLLERIAKLSTGVSVIRVGATTELEGRDKLERVKDAVGAAKSAQEEGVVLGGGLTFYKLQEYIKNKNEGSEILISALESVIKKVMKNCGLSDEMVYKYLVDIDYSLANGKNLGFEAMSGEIRDLEKEGILDPAKVIRLAIENGTSVATMILTTNTLIDYPEYLDKMK